MKITLKNISHNERLSEETRTYFAQVVAIDAIERKDRFRVWIGTSFDEIQAPETLRHPIAAYGALSDDMVARLRTDRGETSGART